MESEVKPYVYPEGCAFKSLDDIQGKKITVMGLGLNGGGEAAVRFFLRHGAFVTVTDMKTSEQLAPTIKRLNNDPTLDKDRFSYILGCHKIEDFADADCVIKNPGVKIQGNKYLAVAKKIESDISIFLHFTKAPIIAVTGSKGKSSTVSALDFGLRNAGFKAFLGGNITVSPLTFLERTDGTTPVVLELSSWQLADLRGRKALKPKIAIITKIMPDHQNWYGNMESYVADKKLIYADQDSSDFTILDFDEDDYLKDCENPEPGCKCWGDVFAKETKGTVLRYSKYALPKEVMGAFQKADGKQTEGFLQLPEGFVPEKALMFSEKDNEVQKVMGRLEVPGDHMKTNVLNASLAMRLMSVAPKQICAIMGTWKGISHRLEKFHDWTSKENGIKFSFYNDSCATVPEAAAAASQAFGRKVILLTGGTDKNLNFEPLAKVLRGEGGSEAKYVPLQTYLLAGNGTEKLIQLVQPSKKILGPFDSLEIMLGMLKSNLQDSSAPRIFNWYEGDDPLPVVFSPGATSFGMFTNEFDRGNKFKDAVKQVFGEEVLTLEC